jgi:hypothetical protein
MNLSAPITPKQAMGVTFVVALLMTVLLVKLYSQSGYWWVFLVPILAFWFGTARTLILQRRNPGSAVLMMRTFAVPSTLMGVMAGFLAYTLKHGAAELPKLADVLRH